MHRFEDPLRYQQVVSSWPKGTAECAADLARLGLPLDVSSTAALAALKDAGLSRRKGVVLAAMRHRKGGS